LILTTSAATVVPVGLASCHSGSPVWAAKLPPGVQQVVQQREVLLKLGQLVKRLLGLLGEPGPLVVWRMAWLRAPLVQVQWLDMKRCKEVAEAIKMLHRLTSNNRSQWTRTHRAFTMSPRIPGAKMTPGVMKEVTKEEATISIGFECQFMYNTFCQQRQLIDL
jgi:hypothetical protein